MRRFALQCLYYDINILEACLGKLPTSICRHPVVVVFPIGVLAATGGCE